MKKIKYILTLGLAGLLSFSSLHLIKAEEIKIKYGGVEYQYTDIQVKYRLNGMEIPSSYPGIIIDEISLASIDEIFVKSDIDMSYKLNKQTGEIHVKRGKDKLSMKLDSLEAKFNDENRWLPLQPRLIKMPNGKEKLYVPARFLSTTFGFTYTWNPVEGIASLEGQVIHKEKNSNTSKKGKVTKKKKLISILANGKVKKYRAPKIVFYSDKREINNPEKPGVYFDSKLFAPAKTLFLNPVVEGGFSYDKKKKSFKLEFEDKLLELKVGKTEGKLNKKKIKLKKAPVYVKYDFSKKSDILIPIEEVGKLLKWKVKRKGDRVDITLPAPKKVENVEVKKTEQIQQDENKEGQNTQETKESKLLFEWKNENQTYLASPGAISYLKNPSDLTEQELKNGENPSLSSILNVMQLEDNSSGKFDTYMLVSDNAFSEIASELRGKRLSVELKNYKTDAYKRFPFRVGGLANSVDVISNENTTTLWFDLSEEAYSHTLSLSEDGKILTVKILRHGLISVEGVKDEDKYKIIFKSTGQINLDTLDRLDSEFLRFTVKGAVRSLSNNEFLSENAAEGLKQVSYYRNGEEATLSVLKDKNYGYFIYQSPEENKVEIIFDKLDKLMYSANISLPENLGDFEIQDEDDYLNKKFSVVLPFKLDEYLRKNPIYFDWDKVLKTEIEEINLNETKITFYLKEMGAYQIIKTGKTIGIRIGKANEFYKNVVVIDPGHGRQDTGALSRDKKFKEKDIVSAVGYKYLKKYVTNPDIKVYWTRPEDSFMELTDRAKFASRIGADIFISIHANAAAGKKANGTETYYSTRNNDLKPNGLSSYVLASLLQKNFTSTMKTTNRGVKSNIFVVTNINTVPAVLLELGFMTNDKDIKMLSNPEKQDEMAKVIYSTIEEIFTKYPTGR